MRLKRIAPFIMSLCLTASLLAGAALAVGEEYIATRPEGVTIGYGMEINGHFTYCVNRHLAWPASGTRYEKPEDDGLDDETRALIARALDAGFPSDLFGLTRLEPEVPEELQDMMSLIDYYGTCTQYALWYALGDDNLADTVESSALISAIYEYAMTGALPEGYTDVVGAVNVDVPAQVELIWDAEQGCYTGQVTFTANKGAELTVVSLPEGAALQIDGVDVQVGDKLYVNHVITVTAEDGAAPAGELAFSYISYQRVDEDTVTLFAPLDTPDKQTGKDAYQNMMGYEMKAVELDPGVSFLLDAKPGEPVPPDTEEPGTPTPDPDPNPGNPDPDPNPGTPDSKPDPKPEPPVEIPDEETPLAPSVSIDWTELTPAVVTIPAAELTPAETVSPEESVIVDETVPLGNLPQTGTVKTAPFSAALCLTSALALAGAALHLAVRKDKNT